MMELRPRDEIEWHATILFTCPSKDCDATYVIGTQPSRYCPQCHETELERVEYVPRRFVAASVVSLEQHEALREAAREFAAAAYEVTQNPVGFDFDAFGRAYEQFVARAALSASGEQSE